MKSDDSEIVLGGPMYCPVTAFVALFVHVQQPASVSQLLVPSSISYSLVVQTQVCVTLLLGRFWVTKVTFFC